MKFPIALFAALSACGPKAPPAAPVPAPVDPLATRPDIPVAGPWAPPAAETVTLANGSDAWVLARNDLPLVSVRLWIPGGTLAGPEDRPGLVTLTDTLLMHGAGDRDGAAFAEHTEQLALTIQSSTWERGTVIRLDCHADQGSTRACLWWPTRSSGRASPTRMSSGNGISRSRKSSGHWTTPGPSPDGWAMPSGTAKGTPPRLRASEPSVD